MDGESNTVIWPRNSGFGDDGDHDAHILHPSSSSASKTTEAPGPLPTFETLYHEHFAFVWRSVRRLGVRPSALDDVVQEVFLVVHKKLAEFEGRSSLKTWLFAVIRRVCADHRRSCKRKPAGDELPPGGLEAVSDPRASQPFRSLEAADLVDRLLEDLDDDKREVFVLAELEQMTLSEIAIATSTNPNTVASRLRAARRHFEQAVERHENEVFGA